MPPRPIAEQRSRPQGPFGVRRCRTADKIDELAGGDGLIEENLHFVSQA
jgi:hypothetical protein